MKKWFLSMAALPLVTQAYAQEQAAPATTPGLHYPTDKGSVLIGSNVLLGGAGFSNNSTYYNVGLTPRAGYFVLNNLAAGIELSGNFSGSSDSYHAQSYGTGLFARYFFGKAAHKDGKMVRTRFFVEGGASYLAGRTRIFNTGVGDEITHTRAFGFRGTAGVNVFLTNSIALEGGIFYQHFTRDYVHNEKFYAPVQLGFNVGVQIYLGRKK